MSMVDESPLGLPSKAPAPEPHECPPGDAAGRHEEWLDDHDTATRDSTPATGTRGEPAPWRPGVEGEHVALANAGWADAGWSFLYGRDTGYGGAEEHPGADAPEVAAASRRMRGGSMTDDLRGPFIKAPVWTWQVPTYFWIGGIASGSAFVALAADLAGDEWAASVARKVALGAVLPAPLLLIGDLGRPARFLNMLRVFKPRSPMNLGAWCLVSFSAAGTAAVGLDQLGRRRAAKAVGAASAVLGGYLGSYTGVLLASTAVPLWSRSRVFLGPVFVSTATATGAAATRLVLAATRRAGVRHPTQIALGRLEASAMLTELVLSTVNERRLGRAGTVLSQGRPGELFRAAKALAAIGVALNLLGPRRTTVVGQHAASVFYLIAGLAFRFAWVQAGADSARDDQAVALTARSGGGSGARRVVSGERSSRARAASALRVWAGAIGAASLGTERCWRRLSTTGQAGSPTPVEQLL